MRISLLCKDMGGYIGKLAGYLAEQGHDVLFLDTSKAGPSLGFLPRKVRSMAARYLASKRMMRRLQNFGPVDVLLVVNPGQIEPRVIERGMSLARVSKAYLYDSLARSHVSEQWLKRYDQVFTFDTEDADRYGLTKLHNFMYEYPGEDQPHIEASCKAFLVMAGLDRIDLLDEIALRLEESGYPNYKFMVQYKRAKAVRGNISFFRERLGLDDIAPYLKHTDILIDLVRPRQKGLSFRIFEGMMYGKKVITNNASVRLYDFYNPANILVIDERNLRLPKDFLDGAYQPVPTRIFERYTLQGWCATVFGTPGP